MKLELNFEFPLAIHERRDVERTPADEFLKDARRRMAIVAMLTEADAGDCGGAGLIADAMELTRAADAKLAGKTVTLGSGDFSIDRLKDLSFALVVATEGRRELDEVQVDAVSDLLLALSNELARHVEREERDLVASRFKSVDEIAAAQVAADSKRLQRPAGKRAKKVAA